MIEQWLRTQSEPQRQRRNHRDANDVANQQWASCNENIGEINDVLISRNGQVVAVMIGVGGFLGIGEKDVAIPMSMLLFQPGAVAADSQDTSLVGKTMSPSPPVTNAQPGAATGTSPPATSAVARHDNGIPDRLILTMTKEQLQSAPAFRDNVSDSSSNIESSGATAPAPPATQRP